MNSAKARGAVFLDDGDDIFSAKPFADFADAVSVGEVDGEGGDGDEAVFHGVEVGAGGGVAGGSGGADFVVGGVAVLADADGGFGDVSAAEAGGAESFELGMGEVGDVHIEQGRLGEVFSLPHFHNVAGDLGAGGEVAGGLVCHGKGEGGDAEEGGFHGGGDGSGVDGVVAHVFAVVDAGGDEVGGAVEESAGEGEVDAVGGGSADAEGLGSDFFGAEFSGEGEGGRGAGAVFGGGDDEDVAEGGEGLREGLDAGGVASVVVGHQDFHLGEGLAVGEKRERAGGSGWEWEWSEREDSNLRPLAPHASALPGCATLRFVNYSAFAGSFCGGRGKIFN